MNEQTTIDCVNKIQTQKLIEMQSDCIAALYALHSYLVMTTGGDVLTERIADYIDMLECKLVSLEHEKN
jgi:hypothetical protein